MSGDDARRFIKRNIKRLIALSVTFSVSLTYIVGFMVAAEVGGDVMQACGEMVFEFAPFVAIGATVVASRRGFLREPSDLGEQFADRVIGSTNDSPNDPPTAPYQVYDLGRRCLTHMYNSLPRWSTINQLESRAGSVSKLSSNMRI